MNDQIAYEDKILKALRKGLSKLEGFDVGYKFRARRVEAVRVSIEGVRFDHCEVYFNGGQLRINLNRDYADSELPPLEDGIDIVAVIRDKAFEFLTTSLNREIDRTRRKLADLEDELRRVRQLTGETNEGART